MKRASNDIAVRTTDTPTDTDPNDEGKTATHQDQYNPRMKSGGSKIKPLSPIEMDTHLLKALTSESEQKNGNAIVKLGAVDWQNSQLPMELTTMIFRLLSHSEDKANISLTCRQFFMSMDAAFPLRRFPGLSNDLQRTCNSNFLAEFDRIQTFEKHIRPNGNYDKALLTPLSPEVRLTIGLAMMIWSSKYTIPSDSLKCQKLALSRFEEDFNAIKTGRVKNSLKEILALALNRIQPTPKENSNKKRNFLFGVDELKLILESTMLDHETRMHLLSEMLQLPELQVSTFTYAMKFIDHLSLEAVAKLVIYKSIHIDLLHKRFAKLSPEEKPAAAEKIITVANDYMSHFTIGNSIYSIEKILNICSFALSSCEPQQTEVHFEMLSKMVSMLPKLLQTSTNYLLERYSHAHLYASALAQGKFLAGYNLRDTQSKKKWTDFKITKLDSGQEFKFIGVLCHILVQKIMQFPASKSTPLLNELDKSFPFKFSH